MATNASTPVSNSITAPSPNSTGPFNIGFAYIKQEDVKVTVNGVAKNINTDYTFSSATQITFNSAVSSGSTILFVRDTAIDQKTVDFVDGSVLTEADLDNNTNQVLFAQQELVNDYVKRDGSLTVTGNLVFEGATDNTNETTLAITDPTADRTITIPDVSGTVVTTGDTDTVSTAMLRNDIAISTTGSITSGSLTVNNNVVLGSSTSDIVTINGLVNTGIFPASDNSFDLGANTFRWKDIYADGTIFADAIRLDDATGKLQIGSSPDLELYHDNTDGYIDNNKGDLYVRNNVDGDDGGDIHIQAKSGEEGIVVTDDGNVKLHSDGVLKFQTSFTNSLSVYGNTSADHLSPTINNSFDLGHNDLRWQDIFVNNINGDAIVTSGTSTSDTQVYSSKRAGEIFYGKDTLGEIQSGETWSATDDKIATTAAIDARIIDLVDDVGGFVPIANETSFPNANPDINNGAGTLVSVPLANDITSNGSGVITIANGTLGNSTVTINGATTSSTFTAGFGIIVETTSTLNTYTFHRYVPKATEVTTVAGSIANVNTVAGAISNVNAVGTNIANVNSVAGNASNINSAVSNAGNINAAVSNATNINTVAGNNANVTTVAGISANVATVAGNNTNINTVAGISANVTTIADISSNVTTVANDGTDIGLVAGSIGNVNTVATNVTSINDFADRYRIATSDPSSNNDAGDLYFNSSTNQLKVYTGSAWQEATSLNVAGGAISGDITFVDNAKLQLGASQDLQLYHDGSHSRIDDVGSGSLLIQTNGTDVQINKGTSENIAKFIPDGEVELFYDGSKKLETTSTGVDVTGNITTSGQINISGTQPRLHLQDTNNDDDFSIYNLNGTFTIYNETDNVSNLTVDSSGNVQIPNDTGKLQLGASQDLQIYHDGSHSYIADTGTGNLNITASTVNINNAANSENIARFIQNGAVELYFDNSLKLETLTDGIKVTGKINIGSDSRIEADGVFKAAHGSASTPSYNFLNDNDNGMFRVTTNTIGFSTGGTERLRIDSSGRLLLGTTTEGSANADDLTIATSGSTGMTIRSGTTDFGRIFFSDATSGNGEFAGFIAYDHGNNKLIFGTNESTRLIIDSSGNVGAPSGSNIYNASDSRLKKNVVDIDKGLSAVKSLRPVSFNWIDGFCDAEKDTLYGFIAQEVQSVDNNLIQDFATELTINENKIENVLRVNEKFIIPMLVKAIQELSAKVEALEAS